MHNQLLCGAAVAGLLLFHGLQSANAYDTEQVATDRGNVPLYVPSNPDPDASLPLIVSLHGFTSSGNQHENYFRLRNEIDDQQFLLCVPNGTTNFGGTASGTPPTTAATSPTSNRMIPASSVA